MLFDVLTGDQITSIEGVAPIAFSPDGSLLAYSTPKTYSWGEAPLLIWDINAGEPLQLDLGWVPSSFIDLYKDSLVFSPDGSTVANIFEPVTLRDLLTGERIMPLESGLDPYLDFPSFEAESGEGPIGVFSPDGKILAATWLIKTSDDRRNEKAKGVVNRWDMGNGELIATLDGHADPTWCDTFCGNPITAIAFSTDGSLLATGAKDKTIVLWSVQDSSMLKVLEGHSAAVNSLSFSPDGNYLYSGSLDGTVITWDLEQPLP